MKIIFCKTENKLDFPLFNELLKTVSCEKREVLLKNIENLSAHTRLLSYVCLRSFLCESLNLKNTELVFLKNESGKPYLINNPLCFNLSHTKDAFVIAFSDSEVGIDIECEREISDKIKDKYFTKEEKDENEILVWTKKEAIIKLLGTGMKDISKADTHSTEFYFFTNEKEKYKISCATYEKQEIEFIQINSEKIIEEGILLEEI